MASYPLQPSPETYLRDVRHVSISSEDRNITKYPNASEFEIELPQDICNVTSVRLRQWTFPSNSDTFSIKGGNNFISFKFTQVYQPPSPDDLWDTVNLALNTNLANQYLVEIEEGFYNPEQMAAELTNKFNNVVTLFLIQYFSDNGYTTELQSLYNLNGYNEFQMVYDSVGQKMWFGNKSSVFTITNTYVDIISQNAQQNCIRKTVLPDFSNWGLPSNLGFIKTDVDAHDAEYYLNISPQRLSIGVYNGQLVPRFFYTNAALGQTGFWLLPDLAGATPYYLSAPNKIHFFGEPYMYMEITAFPSGVSLNCIDESSPYNVSNFTQTTNSTNGIANSAFAKIAIVSTPISQYFDQDPTKPYKWFNPPAERIRKLRIKLRYHNGQLVDFEQFNWSMLLEFATDRPQPVREKKVMIQEQL